VLEAEHGPQCDEAADGILALEKMKKKRYDLVLTDIDMPQMTGPEVCRYLRENPPYPNLKVVMMSGRADPDEMARMLLNGANDYLVKPLSIVQLQSNGTDPKKRASSERLARATHSREVVLFLVSLVRNFQDSFLPCFLPSSSGGEIGRFSPTRPQTP
jgi:CheY-like chemotaxis protein